MTRTDSRSHKKPAKGARAGLALEVLLPKYAICRLNPEERIPAWALEGSFTSISKSSEELSVVCEEDLVPGRVQCDRGWRAIRVIGPLELNLVGVMAALTVPLARVRIGLFTVSTYDTDYLLVRNHNLARALKVLRDAGHVFERRDEDEGETPAVEPQRARRERPRSRRDRDERQEPDEEGPRRVRSRREPDTPDTPAEERPRRGRFDQDEESPRRERDEERPRRAREERDEERPRRVRKERDEEPRRRAPAAEKAAEPETETAERPRPRRTAAASVEERVSALRASRTSPRPLRASKTSEDDAGEVRRKLQPSSLPTREIPVGKPSPDGPSASPTDKVPVLTAPPARPAPDTPPAPKRQDEVDDREVDSTGLFTGAIPQHPVETTDEPFENLGLSAPILATVKELGFAHPTPVQAQVIPVALAGRDVVGLAETGSGKTAAFVLPLAERLTHGSGVRGLILCPTREIALQTEAFLKIFGRKHELDTLAVIGGVRMGPQIDGLRREPDILVATPGRLADHMRRGNVHLAHIEALVLDEADHMLDLGFLPQLKEILQDIPTSRQTMMFSATMPNAIRSLANTFMRDPVRVDIRPKGHTAAGIEHRVYLLEDEEAKKACLFQLLKDVNEGQTLIFVRRKLHTEWLARQIELQGFEVERIHSDRSQGQRVNALRGFREGHHRILVATDVAARGLDIPGMHHVINFGAPDSVEDYVHRAGRTARGSAKGIVSIIATWQDKEMIREIEVAIGQDLARCEAQGVEAYKELAPRRKTVRRRRLL